MVRSLDPEVLDQPGLSDECLERAHRDLTRTHRWLGHTGLLLRSLRRHPFPLRRVMDVGCGRGGLLLEIRKHLNVEVIGVDVRAPAGRTPVPIVRGDAVRHPLPQCDVALAVCLVHHLSEAEFVQLIQNVRRSARRFLVLDLVRHPLPLLLFRGFVAPFVYPVNAVDGIQSIRRSFTGAEMHAIVREALRGTGATFRHRVAPFYTHQLVDISW
jgi:SAM-dependent methyltransferase